MDEALRIRTDVLGSDHPRVADVLFEIGRAHFNKGQMSSCLDLWKQALGIRKEKLGNHKDTAKTLYVMGLLHSHMEHPVTSIDLFEQALAVYRETGRDDDNEPVASILQNLQALRQRLKGAAAA